MANFQTAQKTLQKRGAFLLLTNIRADCYEKRHLWLFMVDHRTSGHDLINRYISLLFIIDIWRLRPIQHVNAFFFFFVFPQHPKQRRRFGQQIY